MVPGRRESMTSGGTGSGGTGSEFINDILSNKFTPKNSNRALVYKFSPRNSN